MGSGYAGFCGVCGRHMHSLKTAKRSIVEDNTVCEFCKRKGYGKKKELDKSIMKFQWSDRGLPICPDCGAELVAEKGDWFCLNNVCQVIRIEGYRHMGVILKIHRDSSVRKNVMEACIK